MTAEGLLIAAEGLPYAEEVAQ